MLLLLGLLGVGKPAPDTQIDPLPAGPSSLVVVGAVLLLVGLLALWLARALSRLD